MEIDAITRNKINEVVFSSTEPPSTNVLWGKPTMDNVEMYVFKNGSWVKLKDKEIDPIVKAYVDNQYAAIQEELKKDRKHVSDIAEDKDYKYTVVTKKIEDINTEVTSLDTEIDDKYTEIQTSLSKSRQHVSDVQNMLTDWLNNEITRAKDAEQSLDTKITNETSRAKEAENALQGNITNNANAITTLGNTKQDALVSGTNIKTINNESVLGEGNIKTAPDVWANVLSIEDTALLVDGKKVELPAHKNVIIKDFRSVKVCKKENENKNYPLLGLALFDIHYNGKLVPMDEFDLCDYKYSALDSRGCSLLYSLDLSGFDTTNMTSLEFTFKALNKIPYFNISGWNTSNVTTMEGMFKNNGVKTLYLGGWDTSKVTAMDSAFDDCGNLTYLEQNFNTSKCQTFRRMFCNDSALTTLDVSNWDVRNVYTFSAMFLNCRSLTELDTSNWVASKSRDFSYLFGNCVNLKTLDVSKFDLTYDTGSHSISSGCSYLSDITFGRGWGKCILDLSNVATRANYKFTDNTYNSMIDMLDRVAENLTTTFTIKFSSKHNIPDDWVQSMTLKGYTMSIV